MDYDIIGDVHGHAAALRSLLAHLGYREKSGVWRHPDRQAIFVGDFIDRGPRQIETVDLVRSMVEGGSALAVMGNHEFNAIAWHTPDPEEPSKYLRPRHGDLGQKNRKQHARFLEEVEGTTQHDRAIDWFLTLPLWLDLPDLRIVHACWDQESMDALVPLLTAQRQLPRALVEQASRRNRIEFRSVERLTKGIEVELPDGHSFLDKDGHERRNVRIRWWEEDAISYRALALMPSEDLLKVPDIPVPADAGSRYLGEKPVFFGHYWMQGDPAPQSRKTACVDYSVAKGGKLVAYRFEAGEPLSAANYTWARS